MKRLIAFDLDGTLSESKQPLDNNMAAALAGLLNVAEVAVISGGDWPQFEKQVVGRLPEQANHSRLWIMPTTGAKLYRYREAGWQQVYANRFDRNARNEIIAQIDKAVAEVGLDVERRWGRQIEDRETQLTFSALGQEAPLTAKKAWDPDLAKRKKMQTLLRQALPNLSVNIGGSTSIDITEKGVDKGYALARLAQESEVPLSEMLFVGDAVYPGGNDYPAKLAGVDTIAVRDVDETRAIISAITLWMR